MTAKQKTIQRDNFICNFRAPDLKHFEEWNQYKQFCWDLGLDVCRVTIGLTNAFMTSDTKQIQSPKTPTNQFNIKMDNHFNYNVNKPRRTPYSLDCVKPQFRRTFSSILFEAYVLEKARRIKNSFCFRDFLELKHDSFRRILIRLKRKGLIMAYPVRTNPRFYILTENLKNYDSKKFLKKP